MTTASEQRVREALGDLSVARRRLRNYRDTAGALAAEDLQGDYAGEWVAAYDGKVVGHSDDLPLLLRTLAGDGIPQRDIVVRYVSADSPEFI